MSAVKFGLLIGCSLSLPSLKGARWGDASPWGDARGVYPSPHAWEVPAMQPPSLYSC